MAAQRHAMSSSGIGMGMIHVSGNIGASAELPSYLSDQQIP